MAKVIVIGGGFGGLATAALLAKKGHEVTLIEKNKTLGGRARVLDAKGFRFDMGPSWYLMPEVFEKYFAVFGKKTTDYYSLKRLDPGYKMFFGGAKTVDIFADLEKNKKLFDSLEPDGGKKLEKYLEIAKYQYEVAMGEFLYRPYLKVADLIDLRLVIEGMKLRVFESMDKYVKRFFDNDEARKILEYNLVFLGGNPKNTPALYSLMSHVDLNLGVWYPDGGMGEVVKAFVKLGKELGVKYVADEEVTKFEILNSKIQKIITIKNSYECEVVVSGADYHHVETKLLPSEYQSYPEKYWAKRTMAPSAFIMYLGFDKKIKGLINHNLFLQNDWMAHFDQIFDHPAWPDAPSYYISCPSKIDKSVAPKGCENIFVLVPIAANLTEDLNSKKAYGDKILAHMSEFLKQDLSSSLIFRRDFSVSDFAHDYNAYQGTALGLAHTLFQTALLRPQQKSKKVDNLYYVGQYTHPGIGVPMCLISAEVVAGLI